MWHLQWLREEVSKGSAIGIGCVYEVVVWRGPKGVRIFYWTCLLTSDPHVTPAVTPSVVVGRGLKGVSMFYWICHVQSEGVFS